MRNELMKKIAKAVGTSVGNIKTDIGKIDIPINKEDALAVAGDILHELGLSSSANVQINIIGNLNVAIGQDCSINVCDDYIDADDDEYDDDEDEPYSVAPSISLSLRQHVECDNSGNEVTDPETLGRFYRANSF